MHDDDDDDGDAATPHPTHIPIPPPPSFSSIFNNNRVDDPSPDPTQFHTAPSSPNSPFPSPSIYFTPPSSPHVEPPSNINQLYFSTPSLELPTSVPISVPHGSLIGVDRPLSDFSSDDAFPTSIDLALDLGLDDEGLSTLEKIYLFSRSNASFHRVFIAHALPTYLHQVTPQEAIEYVLPLLSGLAMDEDEQVKEALAAELVPVVWWFFTHCQIIPDDLGADDAVYASSSTTVTISVQAFTPILGTLLLSSNPLVGGAARFAVVRLLSRMKKADDKDPVKSDTHSNGSPPSVMQQPGMRIDFPDDDDDDEDEDGATGLFRRAEREMFQHEILQQVVIGMGKLDVDIVEGEYSEGIYYGDSEYPSWRNNERNRNDTQNAISASQTAPVGSNQEQANTIDISRGGNPAINPYFPLLPSTSFTSSAVSTASTDSSLALSSESSALPPELPVFTMPAVASTSTISLPSERPSHISRRSVEYYNAPRTTLPPSPEQLPGPSSSSSPRPISPRASSPAHGEAASSNADDSSSRSLADDWVTPSQRRGRSDLPQTQFLEDQYYPNNAYNDNENNDDEQAAVGRLSSMSLIAAVTASGTLGDATKQAFVKEVERVGRDPVYWVRREASFALGALAKVVPPEVVLCSLLPLFEVLQRDPVWHVRHSVLFALPAILSRLSPDHRRRLALETTTTLCCDESATVRSGVLEALGEVIHTFCEDPLGPPDELVRLFLGRKEDRRVRDGSQYHMSFGFGDENDPPMESFYKDPERPLICGFNFPAVTLTLGRERWDELREFYVDIAANRASKVQRTLAASLGELAKIIGREHAERDLVPVWWDSIRHEDEEVRTRAVGCLETFLDFVSREVGQRIFQGLLTVWDEGVFAGWRERHLITKDLVRLATSMGRCVSETARGLAMKALEDSVAAVREIAIAVLPPLWTIFARNGDLIEFRNNLRSLAQSTNHRRRMTFIAAQQSLVVSDDQNLLSRLDDDLLKSAAILAEDNIDGVRINVARFVGVICGSLLRASRPVPELVHELVDKLSQDSSSQVRSYVPNLSRLASDSDALAQSTAVSSNRMKRKLARLATFSRPPASTPSQDITAPFERPSAIQQGGNQARISAHESMSADDRFDTGMLLVPRNPDDGSAMPGSDRVQASFSDQLLSARAALQPGFDDARVCA